MPAVARLGDVCTGHECWPSRPNASSSPSVFVNGRGVHRKSDAWQPHTCVSTHSSVLASGSPTVFVNGLDCGRIGDPVACGSKVLTGSYNVFCD